MKTIPLYGNHGETLKGFQLMLVPKFQERKLDKHTHYLKTSWLKRKLTDCNADDTNNNVKLIIKFPDHCFDDLAYKYKSKLIQLDIKKIYVKETSDFERYYILSSSQIRSQFVHSQMFNNFELHQLLRQSNTTLMNMIPFKFSHLILDEIKFDVNQTDFFKNMEILFGKSLSDLFLKNPTKIK